MNLVKKYWYDVNSTPPTNYIWVKAGEEYVFKNGKWVKIEKSSNNGESSSDRSSNQIILSGFNKDWIQDDIKLQMRKAIEDGTLLDYTYVVNSSYYNDEDGEYYPCTYAFKILSYKDRGGISVYYYDPFNFEFTDADITAGSIKNIEMAIKVDAKVKEKYNFNGSIYNNTDDDTGFSWHIGPFTHADYISCYTSEEYDELNDEYDEVYNPVMLPLHWKTTLYNNNHDDYVDDYNPKMDISIIFTNSEGYIWKAKMERVEIHSTEDEGSEEETQYVYKITNITLSEDKLDTYDWSGIYVEQNGETYSYSNNKIEYVVTKEELEEMYKNYKYDPEA